MNCIFLGLYLLGGVALSALCYMGLRCLIQRHSEKLEIEHDPAIPVGMAGFKEMVDALNAFGNAPRAESASPSAVTKPKPPRGPEPAKSSQSNKRRKPAVKVTSEIVKQIRDLMSEGATYTEISRKLGLSRKTTCRYGATIDTCERFLRGDEVSAEKRETLQRPRNGGEPGSPEWRTFWGLPSNDHPAMSEEAESKPHQNKQSSRLAPQQPRRKSTKSGKGRPPIPSRLVRRIRELGKDGNSVRNIAKIAGTSMCTANYYNISDLALESIAVGGSPKLTDKQLKNAHRAVGGNPPGSPAWRKYWGLPDEPELTMDEAVELQRLYTEGRQTTEQLAETFDLPVKRVRALLRELSAL